MSDEPERFDVLLSNLIDQCRHDVLQEFIVGRADPHARGFSGRRRRRRNDQPVLVLVIQQREVVTLPVPARPAPCRLRISVTFSPGFTGRPGLKAAATHGDVLRLQSVLRLSSTR
jgi:hypothetical protein